MSTNLRYELRGSTIAEIQTEIESIISNAENDPAFHKLLPEGKIKDGDISSINDSLTIAPVKEQGLVEGGVLMIGVGFAVGVGTRVTSEILIDLWKLYILKKLEEKRGIGTLTETKKE